MSSGAFDAMPHNGVVITTLAVAGLTHANAYKHIFWGHCDNHSPVLRDPGRDLDLWLICVPGGKIHEDTRDQKSSHAWRGVNRF